MSDVLSGGDARSIVVDASEPAWSSVNTLAYVREGATIYATAKGNPQGAEGMANFPDSQLDAVVESAEECPGECIFIEID